MIKEKISRLVDNPDRQPGRAFAFLIQLLIIFSLVTFSLETLPGLSAVEKHWLFIAEVTTVGIFTVEYALRLVAAEKPLRFVFSFYGLVDLLAILPFYLTVGLDLRSVRVLRLFRLVRILKLFRYNKALKRFHRALILIREELIIFGVVAMVMLFLSSVGIYYCENTAQPDQFKSIFHSLWWALTTLTTVGYGDMYPITAAGKFFTFFVLMVGLGIIAVPTGLIASALTQARDEEKQEQEQDN